MRVGSDWRNHEPSLSEILSRHPDFPPPIALKIDVLRRGVVYSPEALTAVDPERHITEIRSDYYDKADSVPVSLILPDGTSIFTEGFLSDTGREPYLADREEGRVVLKDMGRTIEEAFFWEKPDYYSKFTSKGRPMWQIVSARPQRLTIHPNQFCDFWKEPGQGCKFCVMAHTFKKGRKPPLLDAEDILETVAEALKEPGRNVSVFLTGGSITGGKNPFDHETDLYESILSGISRLFRARPFPSQLISTALDVSQLRRLRERTGLSCYTADIEVLEPELFQWLCPGKAKSVGYQGWKERLYRAVDIFGDGNVNTGLVAGVETAGPKGFADEGEALEKTLAEAQTLFSRGVGVVGCVWRVLKGSVLQNESPPSLEYYVQLAKGLDSLRRKYRMSADMDNYRRCGNHPDTDLARV
jgi:hypothetical protein